MGGVWYVVRYTACVFVSVFDAKYLGNYGRYGVVYYWESIREVARQNRMATSLMKT